MLLVLVVLGYGKGAEIGFMIYEAFRKISQNLVRTQYKKVRRRRIMSEVTRYSPTTLKACFVAYALAT